MFTDFILILIEHCSFKKKGVFILLRASFYLQSRAFGFIGTTLQIVGALNLQTNVIVWHTLLEK